MYAVIGLGSTGLSVVNYLTKKKIPCFICDSRLNPPDLAEFQRNFPTIPHYLGEFPDALLLKAETIILSPGVPRSTPLIQQALTNNIPVIGDIELFVQAAKAPIIAITGTNAKSTVTTMIGDILTAAGLKILLGGNIGIPALNLLSEETPDYYILELSSFQLESVFSLHAAAAVILNISHDHLNHHGTIEQYIAAKQRIYQNATRIIENADDSRTFALPTKNSVIKERFGLSAPSQQQAFGITNNLLMYHDEKIIDSTELSVIGQHNQLNALAASALAITLGISIPAINQGLKNYRGLPHRCELILEDHNRRWYNDSKGTNVGATHAALSGLGIHDKKHIILIAGGQAKGQDFSPLQISCQRYVRALILFGQDAKQLYQALSHCVAEVFEVETLQQAVACAQKISQTNDLILLSPACASLDMFKNYADRGEQFKSAVKAMVAKKNRTI